MLKEQPDDTPVVTPEATVGRKTLIDIEDRARKVYPDHAGSREQYVREKIIQKLDELAAKVQTLEKPR